MFISDSPISGNKEDKLNRTEFSLQLGKALLKLDHKESLTIGLCGPWGSGKSSILNMALEEIQKTGSKKAIVFRFNPWNFSGQNKLISTFLIELGNTIGYVDNSKEAKRIGDELITYSKFFVPLAIPIVFTQTDLPLRLLVLPLISILYWTFEKVGIAVQKWGDLKEKTLEKFKESINTKIKKLNRKIIVVIDDIDRLTDDEIRQVVQLVKQTADFSNITYVLAFDDNQVAKVLGKSSFNGREYLEKIVQVHFQVPLLSRDLLEKYFLDELDKVIKPFPQKLWEGTHWGQVYYGGIQNFLKSLRNVKRFINTLKFNISLVPNEINPVDFIGIESLRVFTPELYNEISVNKELFTKTESSGTRDSTATQNANKAKLEKIISLAREENKTTVTNILRELFPQTESILGNMSYGHEWQETWSKARRVCAENRFLPYFFLDIPSGEISQSLLDAMIKLSNNRKATQQVFRGVNKKGIIKKLLDRLPDFKDEIPTENIQNYLLGLFDESDSFPHTTHGMFDEYPFLKVCRIAYHLLKRVGSFDDREKIFTHILINSKSLMSPLELVHFEMPSKDKKEKSEEKLLVRPEYRETLKKLSIKKIELFAKKRLLNTVPGLQFVLFLWKEWGEPNKPREYVEKLIKTDSGLINFIEGFMWQGTSQYMDSRVSTTTWKVNTKNMLTFVDDLNTLKQRVEKFPKRFSKKHKLAVDVFLDSFNKKEDQDD